MSSWKLLTTRNENSACMLDNASIRWTNDFDAYHVIGRVEMQHVSDGLALFRIVIDGTKVLWKEDGSKQRGPPIKHCLYLPSDGSYWKVSSHRVKSSRRPDYKAFAITVNFPPNAEGIAFLQVSVEVTGMDTSEGERFAEALQYANTWVDRKPVATDNDTAVATNSTAEPY
jgi:hypothetical protein